MAVAGAQAVKHCGAMRLEPAIFDVIGRTSPLRSNCDRTGVYPDFTRRSLRGGARVATELCNPARCCYGQVSPKTRGAAEGSPDKNHISYAGDAWRFVND
jgi:hypothetical protein